jgi:tetratricopeptide (TPR) repeat protein
VYNLLGICYITTEGRRREVTVRFGVPILIFLNLMNVIPWVLINASDRSVERIKATLPADPGLYWASHPPIMHLSIAFEANGLLEEAFTYYKKYHRENPDDMRGHFNYAKQLLKRNRLDDGIREFEKMMEVSPYCPWSYRALVTIYDESGQHDKVYNILKRMFAAYSQNPRPFREFLDRQELKEYLDFLYRAELDRGDEAAARAVREVLEAADVHQNTSPN